MTQRRNTSHRSGCLRRRITRRKCNNNRPSRRLICKRLEAKRFSLGAKARGSAPGSAIGPQEAFRSRAPPHWLPLPSARL
ncbi:unnamed protein product [Pieris brassicae]|uniref:Uncharacterized protein n=1 Tax=Pieris brassicae TaxID=7116 RepID=A0A9P0SSA4_PIEBR|nr:unnamed protein product [Pieris brassicae]